MQVSEYYHVNKIKQNGWLIYSWIINELFDTFIRPNQGQLHAENETVGP